MPAPETSNTGYMPNRLSLLGVKGIAGRYYNMASDGHTTTTVKTILDNVCLFP